MLHLWSDFFCNGKNWEVNFDDISFQVYLDCASLFPEEDYGVVVHMIIILHLFSQLFLFKRLFLLFFPAFFLYGGEKLLDYPLFLFFFIDDLIFIFHALVFSLLLLVEIDELVVVIAKPQEERIDFCLPFDEGVPILPFS